ncbi:MAG: hypothetical protein E6Q88_05670 [Lysobacteraceae bacterium]|nr:MAG: hypothetical protein E6Q88_05670 [Xanthomonadaceae bacterium]
MRAQGRACRPSAPGLHCVGSTGTGMEMARTLDDIAAALKLGRHHRTGCTLLIGAGCSKTAGIPLASGIVERIRTDPLYQRVYHRALERAQARHRDHDGEPLEVRYADCMAEMEHGDQRELIRGYIDGANLNWAHAGMAALIKHGYVGRILTTNFDSLLARTCAVFNELPAVYDLTMSRILRYHDLPEKAIFHLHGQRYGFSLLNNTDELEEHKRHLRPLFDHARDGRTWIVCGYSGLNDPLFDLIQDCDRYDHALYWIGLDAEPHKDLRSLFCGKPSKGCHYLQFAGADEFFMHLCGALGISFPFMHAPLEHIEEILGQFVEFPTGANDQGLDLLKIAKGQIAKHKAVFADLSAAESADQKIAETIATQGVEAAVSALAVDHASLTQLSSDVRARIAFMQGYEAQKRAENAKDKPYAIQQYTIAAESYRLAVETDPRMSPALTNWGMSLDEKARLIGGDEGVQLCALACEKYEMALKIDPESASALNNWGNALADIAKFGHEQQKARQFLDLSLEKLSKAEALSPGQSAYNLACVHALRGELSEMVEWLDRSHAMGKLPSRERIGADKDFDEVRKTPEFSAWWTAMGWDAPHADAR